MGGLLRLADAAGLIAVRDSLITRVVGNEVRRVGVLDRAAVCIMELAGLRVCKIVRGEG